MPRSILKFLIASTALGCICKQSIHIQSLILNLPLLGLFPCSLELRTVSQFYLNYACQGNRAPILRLSRTFAHLLVVILQPHPQLIWTWPCPLMKPQLHRVVLVRRRPLWQVRQGKVYQLMTKNILFTVINIMVSSRLFNSTRYETTTVNSNWKPQIF